MNLCDEIEIITDFVKVDKKYLKLCKDDKMDLLNTMISKFKDEIMILKKDNTISKYEFNNRYYNFYQLTDIVKIIKLHNIITEESIDRVFKWCNKSKSKLFNLRITSNTLLVDDGLAIMGESIKEGSYII